MSRAKISKLSVVECFPGWKQKYHDEIYWRTYKRAAPNNEVDFDMWFRWACDETTQHDKYVLSSLKEYECEQREKKLNRILK